MSAPDTFGARTVATVLRRERATFADNLKRCRDAHQIARYEQILDAFDAELAHIEQRITQQADTHLQAVA